ncbi:hypothetical protein [Maricaulis sp.]|uniref:hypothetical protein n=1 Tax=Maricaulis sp. TaxID=1486257 RepID=UPI003A901B41
MLALSGLLIAGLLQTPAAAAADGLHGLPSLPNGHYVERTADGGSACGDVSARWFDLDVRVPDNNPGGVDGHAGELALALGADPVVYQLTYALAFAEPDPMFNMRTMNMIDGTFAPADGSAPYALRTSILASANGDAEIVSATASDGGPPIHLISTVRTPEVHGTLSNGTVLQPFQLCPAGTN